MAIVKPKNYTVVDMYITYCLRKVAADLTLTLEYDAYYARKGIRLLVREKKGGGKEVVMTYALFRNIIETYNNYAAQAVIEGAAFSLGNKLGYIHGRRIERDFNRPKVNVIATVKARRIPGQETHPAIYHTDEDYCRIGWAKLHRIRNESVYSFVPASHTFKDRFSQSLMKNPVLKFNYTYYPFIKAS